MTKSDLATQLRARFARRIQNDEEFRREFSDLLQRSQQMDDDEVIEAHATCAECGAKHAEGAELDRIIAESRSDDDFFDQLHEAAKASAHASDHWPTEIDAE
jgi:hypothetical protein